MAMALESGEVQGMTLGMSSLQLSYSKWLEENRLRFLLLFTKDQRWPRLPDVPTAMELAKTPEDRALIGLIDFPFRIARPVMAPKLQPEPLQILRQGLADTCRDPAFLADGERLKLDISPLDGEEVDKILEEVERIPRETVARYKEIVQAK